MQNKFFLVTHRHTLLDSANYKYIWIFSSKNKAKSIVDNKISKEEGFKDYPEGFMITELLIDDGLKKSGKWDIFFLQYENVENDDVWDIGIFSSERRVQKKIDTILHSGLDKNNFSYEKKNIDFEWWKGGFVRV